MPDISGAVESASVRPGVPVSASSIGPRVPTGVRALSATRRGLWSTSMTPTTVLTVVSTSGVFSVSPIENEIHCRDDDKLGPTCHVK